MEERKKYIIDLSSATTKPIEVVDNNSNHTETSLKDTYRLTTEIHNRESSGTLSKKVDQTLSSPFDSRIGFTEGSCMTIEIVTSSGTKEIKIFRNQNSLSISSTGSSNFLAIPLVKKLFEPNKNGEYADILRAILILTIYYCGFNFRPAKVEERGFRILENKLKNHV